MEGDESDCFLLLRAAALGVRADGLGDTGKGGCDGVCPGDTLSPTGGDRSDCRGVQGEPTEGGDLCG